MSMRNTNIKLLFFLLFLFFVAPGIEANAQFSKSKLKVLYVGGTTDTYEMFRKLSIEERQAEIKRRMASFEIMLKNYFDQVTVVHSKDYRAELSAAYDVTVMDGKTSALPEDFSNPMLFIAETSVVLGARIGLKFDWYCLCLKEYALNMRMEHDIFKKPFSVKIMRSPLPLPFEASMVNYRVDKPFPAIIPMWKVQTVAYDQSNALRPGLVCHSGGFEDSPDAENISGGSSLKDGNALAIGRHGNFFHWGFAASPEYLTEEAQTVLANAIVYISKFKGKKPIARKFADRIKTSYDIVGMRDMATVKANELTNGYYKEVARQRADSYKKIHEKRAKGEKLTSWDEILLKSESSMVPEPEDLQAFLKTNQGELFSRFGTDLQAYKNYYDENMPYFYSDGKGNVSIDEDLKSLKIKKGDIRLLDVAIKMLESGQDLERAKRILDRYTLATFTKPEEWRAWFKENKNKFFFSESGGNYYLINTRENVEGNDYNKKVRKTAYQKLNAGETTDENPVSIAASSVPLANGNKELVIRVKIHPGYHIYNYVSASDPYIQTEVKVTLPEGYKAVGDLKTPAAILYNVNNTSVFKDEAIFVQEVAGKGTGEAVCIISYQCCNNDICYPPVDADLKVKI